MTVAAASVAVSFTACAACCAGSFKFCTASLATSVISCCSGCALSKWGCDVSTKLTVKLHQYDCFNTEEPKCPAGDTVFHAECIGPTTKTEEGLVFDTLQNQLAKNGDANRRVVVKMDVEGAEWDSLLHAPDETLARIDQLAIEFHYTDEERFVKTVRRLKQFFNVAHLHFNNFACDPGLWPFPSWGLRSTPGQPAAWSGWPRGTLTTRAACTGCTEQSDWSRLSSAVIVGGHD